MSSVTYPKPGSAGREIRVRIMTEISAIELKAQEFTVAFTLEASYMEDLKASEEEIRKIRDDDKNYLSEKKNLIKVDHEATNQGFGKLRLKGSQRTFFAPRLSIVNLIEEQESEIWYEVYDGGRLPIRSPKVTSLPTMDCPISLNAANPCNTNSMAAGRSSEGRLGQYLSTTSPSPFTSDSAAS